MSGTKNVIGVKNLGKKYRIGGWAGRYRNLTLRDEIVSSLKAPFRRIPPQERPQDFWALKDVSFDVGQGEVVGIIGRNGAGKSTLLKILSRITTPTEGEADLYGRVGSLLEVGTGFHPELTGRENIFLSGSILGMKRREIDARLDEIVKFSDIEQFLDTPAKRYSSGMFVRLAFAVAAHLETEILLIDEVLAVGDTAFQKKCLGKMGDVATKEGRTVLFVSHSMAAVQQLCHRGIVLDRGRCVFTGEADSAIRHYLQDIRLVQENDLADRRDRRGSQWLKFCRVGLFDESGEEIAQVLSGQNVLIRFFYRSERILPDASVIVAFTVTSATGYLLATLNSMNSGETALAIHRTGYFECRWPKFNLKSGMYDCTLSCSVNGALADQVQSAFSINVEDGDFYGSGKVITRGDVLIPYGWSSHERG